jgi:hypothetical protein
MGNGRWNMEGRNKFPRNGWYPTLLGAPQVTDFSSWKEEVVKFLVSQYHNGNLWIDF